MAISDYELARDARIKRNKQRLQELNLPALFESFHASMRRNAGKQARQPRSLPPRPAAEKRRSSRLASIEPASYDERLLEKADALCERPTSRFFHNPEEVYSDEHVKALGSYTEEWDLFKDGYDTQGNRLYSKESGQTCHQCRQKTLGLRTSCSSCTSLQGVFCGDCLFMRYGENIKEANLNPEWTCPMCRDLCNCSIHRIRRGWAPTGSLYRRAIREGYKSVAHYIVLTNLATPKEAVVAPEAASQTEPLVSVKEPTEGRLEPEEDSERPPLKKSCAQQRQLTDMLPAAKAPKRSLAGKRGRKQIENTPPVAAVGLGRMTRARAAA